VKTPDELRALLGHVLEKVRADHASASYGWGTDHATRFGENAITQNMGGQDEGIRLSVAFGTRHGSASTTRPTDDGIAELVRRAEANAKASPEDPEYVPPPGPQEYPETKQRFFDEVTRMTPMTLAEKVAGAVNMAKEAGYRTGGLYDYGWRCHALANSGGLFVYDRSTHAGCSLTVHGPCGSGAEASDDESVDRLDHGVVARRALQTAKSAQDPRDIEPGDYTVVFAPQAVADLLEFMFWSMDARRAEEGSTAFAGKVGEKIVSDKVTLSTKIDSDIIPCGPSGDSGLAVRPQTWIRAGVLERLQHSRYWAAEKGTDPDPNFLPGFMDGEDRSVEELVAQCESGVLVKRLWYIRFVDAKELLLTGMTRDGFFRIEKGAVADPVKNLRFNESPLVFLKNVLAMSRPERIGGGMVVPGVMSEAFTFSSKTQSV